VLTDYHVHLRPDDREATFERYFTAENVERYLETAAEAGVGELGVAEHVYRFSAALEVWDHEFWREYAVGDLDAYCDFVAAGPLRLGLEMDYVPGREDRIANLLADRDFDYVVGSVHFVGDRAVDDDEFGYDIWQTGSADPDRIWRRYFETIAELVRSGLYDILAHPDLVKMWGSGRPGPPRDPRFYYEPAVEAIAGSEIAVEVSTAGLHKPAAELYPAPAFASMCIDAGAVFSLSSDAHVPEHVGRDYDRAVETMRNWGIEKIAVFEGRERRLEPLG
jgi:histidinol-phosphatase (PHP family)